MNEYLANKRKIEHHAHVPIHLTWISKVHEDEKKIKKGSVLNCKLRIIKVIS
jgi:galactose-1-phosphate uridylyltransferase